MPLIHSFPVYWFRNGVCARNEKSNWCWPRQTSSIQIYGSKKQNTPMVFNLTELNYSNSREMISTVPICYSTWRKEEASICIQHTRWSVINCPYVRASARPPPRRPFRFSHRVCMMCTQYPSAPTSLPSDRAAADETNERECRICCLPRAHVPPPLFDPVAIGWSIDRPNKKTKS